MPEFENRRGRAGALKPKRVSEPRENNGWPSRWKRYKKPSRNSRTSSKKLKLACPLSSKSGTKLKLRASDTQKEKNNSPQKSIRSSVPKKHNCDAWPKAGLNLDPWKKLINKQS